MPGPTDRRGSKRGARLLVQVAANPDCELMVTAAAMDLPLPGPPDGGGDSQSPEGSRLAMANGNRFETAIWRDGQILDALVDLGLLPKSPWVVDYRSDTRPPERIEREVLGHLRAAALGDRAPDLLCHPPLRLAVSGDHSLALAPDYLRRVLVDGRGRYVAGEIKSFHDLGPETDAAALAAAERQVAVYDLALDQAAAVLGLAPADGAAGSANVADLVLRKPQARRFRVSPRPDVGTRHHKAWFRRAALPALERARSRYAARRELERGEPDLTGLPTNLVAACADACPAFGWCLARARETGDLRALGDAAEVFAPAPDIPAALLRLSTDPAAAPGDAVAARAGWARQLRPVSRRAPDVAAGANVTPGRAPAVRARAAAPAR